MLGELAGWRASETWSAVTTVATRAKTRAARPTWAVWTAGPASGRLQFALEHVFAKGGEFGFVEFPILVGVIFFQ